MAFTLSRYLRLRLDSNLTANAKYNLEKLDLLGSMLSIDSVSNVNLRSRGDITVEPQSQVSGGSGVGGTVNIGTVDHPLTAINLFAGSITGVLPDQTGNAGKFLSTDGSEASWLTVLGGGGGGVNASATNWLTADGLTKTFVHNLASLDIIYEVIDLDTDQPIMVDSITVVNSNTISLTASEVPDSSWRVIVHAQ